ncbi:MAG: glycosyltransferase family 4 protein, partial [Verrucomicrobiota bacterium]|nr:glycosyltransferase family 4 protein [Verrucomicrobiota bacterium]
IGAPREKKGIDILMHALQLAREKADLRLLIIGSDFRKEERQRCKDVIDRLMAANALHITGSLDRDRALEIAAEGDMIVMPSLDDGLPNGLLEGMAMGMCPIVSDLFQDLVADGSSGWVVKRYNPARLSLALLDAAQSVEKRARFGAAAKAFITAHHDPAIEAKAYERLFKDIVVK